MLGGVAGGIAEYFDIDPVIVRLLFVLFLFAGGAAFLVYIIGLIVIPKEPFPFEVKPVVENAEVSSDPTTTESVDDILNRKDSAKKILGVLLVVFGAMLFFREVIPFFHGLDIFPMLLILTGIWFIISNSKGRTK